MDHALINRVRSFNRAVTIRTGALDSSYLGRGRPLGQARVLFEIGPEGCDLRSLRDRLGLDSGYLSRLLRSLQAEGLVTVESDAGDRRRRVARLSGTGIAEHAAYDSLSDDLARGLLEALSPAQRTRLAGAMAEVETLLAAASVTIEVEDADGDAARFCLAAYFGELDRRFEGGFDPGKGASGPEGSGPEDTTDHRFLVARLHGRPVGCGLLRSLEPGIGEIKRMWIAGDMRGLGLARRLLAALEDEARRAGFGRVRLDTNSALTEAHALYRTAGYHEIERYNANPYAHLWFEKAL